MLTREYYGMPLTWQRITPGNTLTTISEGVWRYKEKYLNIDSGGTTEITTGDFVIGATSKASAFVLEVGDLSGTTNWAGGNATCALRLKSVCGTFQDNEHITVRAVADDGDANGTLYDVKTGYDYKNMEAKAVLLQADTYAQRIIFDPHGAEADQSSNIGFYLAAGSSIVITDINAIRNIKTIDAVSGSAGSLTCIGFF